MKTLTPKEISAWLRKFKQIEDPVQNEQKPKHWIIHRAPEPYPACEYFVRCFIDQIVGEGELLVVMEDWEPYLECQAFIHSAIRSALGEKRRNAAAPGYRLDFAEREIAVGIFTLACCFQWKSYLYASHGGLTLYNWEGEIFDVWCDSKAKRDQISFTVKSFGLKTIRKPKWAKGM